MHTPETSAYADSRLKTEESYWMFSYSALKSETGAVTGVFCALTEVTPTYLSNRRMRTVQQLTVRTASLATTPAVCDAAISVLSDNTADLPFSLLYLADGTTLRLVGKSGFLYLDRAPKQFDVSGAGKVWTDLSSTNPAFHSALLASLSSSAACMPTSDTFALTDFSASPLTSGTVFIPLRTTQSGDLLGLLVVGRNPRRALDDDYISFLGMTGGAITSALVTARDQEQTQQRMRSLAELDRARTTFFSSVSHEVRPSLAHLWPDSIGDRTGVVVFALKAQPLVSHAAHAAARSPGGAAPQPRPRLRRAGASGDGAAQRAPHAPPRQRPVGLLAPRSGPRQGVVPAGESHRRHPRPRLRLPRRVRAGRPGAARRERRQRPDRLRRHRDVGEGARGLAHHEGPILPKCLL